MAKSVNDWGDAEVLDGADNYRLIWRSYGPEKTGKNYLGLTAPGPIAIHCLDVLGLEGTVAKVKRESPKKDIRTFKYRFSKVDNTRDDACRVRDKFLNDLQISLRNARTVQVDETELWEVFRYAEFGDKSDAPKNYDKLNADYREWIHEFDHSAVNLQLIQKVKEKWETVEETDRNGKKVSKGRPSGRMAPTGFKEVNYVVQANISHAWVHGRGFVTIIENCRQNMALAGEEFVGLDFPTLAQLVFPDSNEGDWQ